MLGLLQCGADHSPEPRPDGGCAGVLSRGETRAFFRALQIEKAADGNLSYKTIRAVMVKKLTERHIQRFEAQLEVEVLPKSVLLTRGWEEATIERFEKSHSEQASSTAARHTKSRCRR